MKTNKNRRQLPLDQRTYVLCHSFLSYQPSYHVLNFTILCCLISNTSKNDSVAGVANNSKVLVNKITVCIVQHNNIIFGNYFELSLKITFFSNHRLFENSFRVFDWQLFRLTLRDRADVLFARLHVRIS